MYRYTDEQVDRVETTDKELIVFDGLQFKSDLVKSQLDALQTANAKITVWAFAHQADNMGVDAAAKMTAADAKAEDWANTILTP